ncbi:hypothetical protein VM1G_11698 [Cytospora mali]|uniref:Mid2 domain-containing protein n=1 Tax=Cytospora mali TaxID=578113 RepID=A0A194W3F8_CYTMA|nr:hypothetical protein VM1G_11698 [Valsa mali]
MTHRYVTSTTNLIFLVGIVTATCYYPDGTIAEDMPCASEGITHCCAKDSICMSNGYCLGTYPNAYILARGSCTDYGWQLPCPQNCIDPEYNNLAGGDNIIFVGGTNAESYRYCCGRVVAYNNTVACEKNQSSFSLGDSEMLFGYAALENASISSATSTSSCTSVSTCNTLGPSYTANSTNGSRSENDNARIAVGIGVPLGIIALLAVAWGFWERRKRINTKPTTVVAGGNIIQNHHHNSWLYHMQPGQQVQGPPAELHSEMSPVEIANSDRGR